MPIPVTAEATLQVLNFIRLEKNPPLARYVTLLILHNSAVPMTSHQVAMQMKATGPQSGTIDSCLRNGLICTAPGPTSSQHYILTPVGRDEAKRLIATSSESIAPPSR